MRFRLSSHRHGRQSRSTSRPRNSTARAKAAETTAALILRSQRSGTFVQNIFHGEAGTVEQYHGPQQIQYALG